MVNLSSLVFRQQAPEWVSAAVQRAPFVVIRRAHIDNGLLPVGIRGSARRDRFAAGLPEGAIEAVARPEDIAALRTWETSPPTIPISLALDLVEGLFRDFTWGPIGSVGFQLASGSAVTTSESDLDIFLRTPYRLPQDTAQRLQRALTVSPVRIDVQLETPAGAIALSEYAYRSDQFLVRTLDGARFIEDPWS